MDLFFSNTVLLMLRPPLGNFNIPWEMSRFVGMWMPGVAFKVVESTNFPNFSSSYHSAYCETCFISVHDVLVVENLVDLDASSSEFWVKAIL